MREILFRGKQVKGGGWAEGYFTKKAVGKFDQKTYSEVLKDFIITDFSSGGIAHVEVIPETVGQFTGKKSKDKQKLFDGDIFEAGDGKVPTLIFWNEINAAWYVRNLRRNEDSAMDRFFDRFTGNKIGNRWDNPGLLGGDRS